MGQKHFRNYFFLIFSTTSNISFVDIDDEKNVDLSSNCSPHKSELLSHGDSSLSPWLGPSRDRDEKDGFSFEMSSPEKEISSRTNFLQKFNADNKEDNLLNGLYKGVSLNVIFTNNFEFKTI